MRYDITRHCKDRYIERVLGNLNNSDNLFVEMLKNLSTATNITSKLSETCPRFVLYVKERYGSIGFNFLKKDHVIYVLTKHKGTKDLYDVITCYVESDALKKFENSALTNEQIYTRLRLVKTKKNDN